MIISHKHKFIYVRVDKTGSTSMQSAILNSGILTDDDITSASLYAEKEKYDITNTVGYSYYNRITEVRADLDVYKPFFKHITPQELVDLNIISEQQLADYKVFFVIRDPIERWISSICYLMKLSGHPVDRKEYFYWAISTGLGNLRSYADWNTYNDTPLLNVDIVEFSNIENYTQSLINKCSGIQHPFPKLNAESRPAWSRTGFQSWTPPKLYAELKERLQQDIDFYNKHCGL